MTTRIPASADVVIVGSGPCGAAYARVLSELAPEADIVTVEVGPLLADPPGVHVRNITDPDVRLQAQRRSEGPTPQGPGGPADTVDQYLDEDPRRVRPGTFLLPRGYRFPGEDGLPAAAMSSNVGGMGAHWTCACPRPGQSERIAFITDLDDLLDEADRLLAVDADALADAPFADEVRKRLGSAFNAGRSEDRQVAPMPLAVIRHADGMLSWSGSDVVFGAPARDNERWTLLPEVLGLRIVVAGDGHVGGLQVRDLRTGAEQVISTRFVVVAADSLRTPQLLWASRIRPPALGHWLNDQTQSVFAVRLRDVDPAPHDEVDPRGRSTIVAQSGVSWVPFTDDEPFHGQVMQLDASPVPLAADDVPAPGSLVGLGWFCAKDLQESDRVEFSDDEMDAYGMPAPQIHYRLTERDNATIEASRAALRKAADALGEPLNDEPMTFPLGTSVHYQGTVRMGETDDGRSVCSPTSRVWGVDGVYVAGNGVIPTATACNPTLTSVALAVAGARDLAARLTTERN